MSFLTIPSSIIQVGKAIKAELFQYHIKPSLDDLNTRTASLESNQGQVVVFDGLVRNAATLEAEGSVTGLSIYRATQNFTLSDCKIGIFNTGSLTGKIEINIRKASSLDDTAAVSVFTTRPSISYSGASNFDESTNAVFDTNNDDLVDGDYLFLDITELPSNGSIGKFSIYLVGEV